MPPFLRTSLLVLFVALASVAGTLGVLALRGDDSATATHELAAGVAALVECPGVGTGASRGERERSEDCQTAQRIQAWLLDAGADDADVVVRRVDSGSLVGPESVTEVTAKVTLGRGPWSTGEARAAIAHLAGTTPDHVLLVDDHLRDLETP